MQILIVQSSLRVKGCALPARFVAFPLLRGWSRIYGYLPVRVGACPMQFAHRLRD